MEEVMDFSSWFNDISIDPVVYEAVYDNITGQVISVGPSHAFINENYKLVIDSEIAERIINGNINIRSCVVDIHNGVMEIAEIKSVFKIDDVLHRVISKEYSEIENPDVMITHCRKSNQLTISVSSDYNGTRKIVWSGDTVMNFLITDYNDPNMLYTMVSVKVSDLLDNPFTVDNLEVPDKFSVYTRRLFKNYVIEYK
jgi:hypothetical protein